MNFDLISPKRPYFKVSTISETLPDKSCIVFAPNGAGKTTIYKNLVDNNPDEIICFSYDSSENPIYKKMEGKQKYIVIDPTPSEYVSVHERCESLSSELSTEAIIIKYFSSKKSDIKNLPKYLQSAYKNKVLSIVNPLSSKQRLELEPLLKYPDDLIRAIKDIDYLRTMVEKEKNDEINAIVHSDIVAAFSQLHLEEHKEEIDKYGCPFCGGKGESGDTYLDMVSRRSLFTANKIVRFRDYKFVQNIFDAKILMDVIDSVLNALLTLNDDQIITLLFSKGNETTEKELVNKIDELAKQKKKETNLIAERDSKYHDMKVAYSYVNSGFSDIYPGCSINLDDETRTIKIVTARAPSTYSEGEKHDMYSKIVQLSTLGSSKKYLLVDDPLTELDAANEYKVVFRFASLSNDNNKKVVIFTCNADLINLAVKQCGDLFDLFYLESSKDANSNIEARLIKMDLGNKQPGKPYLTLQYLTNDVQPSASDSLHKRVAFLVAKRAQIDIVAKNERSIAQQSLYDDASKCLHYHNSYSSFIFNLSNDDLYNFIDTFICPSNLIFKDVVEYKICIIASLRVYVEKKLYIYDEERVKNGFNSILLGVNLLKNKITVVDDVTDFPIRNFYPNWDKKLLMQMKTMLNDCEHPFGLIQPLFFALSIGWGDYSIDISNIKNIFN